MKKESKTPPRNEVVAGSLPIQGSVDIPPKLLSLEPPNSQLIRLAALQGLLGNVSKSTIRRLERNPNSGFPARLRISSRVVAWQLDAVLDWLATRPHGFTGK
ncbi:Prophage CP4-57 regulatory protein (AlpA) [compost metagenome]